MTRNVEENEILHKIFRIVSPFLRYIPCYISENRFPLGAVYLPTMVYFKIGQGEDVGVALAVYMHRNELSKTSPRRDMTKISRGYHAAPTAPPGVTIRS